MIRISQIKLPVEHTMEELKRAAARELKVPEERIQSLSVSRRSVDARKKPVVYVYTVDVELSEEKKLMRRLHNRNASLIQPKRYRFPEPGTEPLEHRPVIVGTGPAGLFCGLMLARAGYRPLLLERGETARARKKTVDRFWASGELAADSNVQFGEGGAGTFSDGKLNTLVKDPAGRGRLVLETFVEAGAPEEILWWSKPHLGTDLLIGVVKRIREEIISLGGEVRFGTKLTDIDIRDGAVRGVRVRARSGSEEREEVLPCGILVLAIGHSARDTFSMLADKGIPMERKAFAVGVRIEHPQKLINESQYGQGYPEQLPAASYKLTRKVGGDRGVYSFCMCPGGYVVNASSEPEMLAVNGMSYQARAGRNANSAMIVTVRPEDFGGAGRAFRRGISEKAGAGGLWGGAGTRAGAASGRFLQKPAEQDAWGDRTLHYGSLGIRRCAGHFSGGAFRGAGGRHTGLRAASVRFFQGGRGAFRRGEPDLLSGADPARRRDGERPAGTLSLRRGSRVRGRNHLGGHGRREDGGGGGRAVRKACGVSGGAACGAAGRAGIRPGASAEAVEP